MKKIKSYSEFITEKLETENKVLDFEQFESEIQEFKKNLEDSETKEEK